MTYLRNTTLSDGLAAVLFSYDEFASRPSQHTPGEMRVTIPTLGYHIEFTADREDLRRIDEIRRAAFALLRRFAAYPAQELSPLELMIISIYQELLSAEQVQ